MRAVGLSLLPFLCLLTGCQHLSLRNHTERQSRTLTDLQYDQVLDNIAMFVENANSLPFFSQTGSGSTSNNYTLSPSGMLTWGLASMPRPLFDFTGASTTLGGTFTANEGWTTNTVLNPDELRLMRCIYQKVVGCASVDCDCEKQLQAYFAGHPCYLETHTERNVRFYQRHGFAVVSETNIPEDGPHFWLMARPA